MTEEATPAVTTSRSKGLLASREYRGDLLCAYNHLMNTVNFWKRSREDEERVNGFNLESVAKRIKGYANAHLSDGEAVRSK
jgi:hypothetical protein